MADQRYTYSLGIGTLEGDLREYEGEKTAREWDEILRDARAANEFYRRLGRRVICIDYKDAQHPQLGVVSYPYPG